MMMISSDMLLTSTDPTVNSVRTSRMSGVSEQAGAEKSGPAALLSHSAAQRMQMVVISVRHHRAPVALREILAFSDEEAAQFLVHLKNNLPLDSAVMLSTCNRTELYVAAPKIQPLLPVLYRQIAQNRGLSDFSVLKLCASVYLNEDAVRHLCRVAAGLDSMILGEDQILGQVKVALQLAQRHQTAGTILDRAFKMALMTGRRVRQETGIAHRDASMSHAALRLAIQHHPDVLTAPVCILGAGKMVDILLSALQSARQEAGLPDANRLSKVSVVNRSEKRLQALVSRFGIRGLMWPQLNEGLASARVLFVATGAPHPVVYPDMLTQAGRAGFSASASDISAPLSVIDMAVPRNVDASVASLPKVQLFNTDDLSAMAPERCAQWMSAESMAQQIETAEAIVLEGMVQFCQWQQGLGGYQTLARFQARLNGLYEAALSDQTKHIEASHRQLVHQASRQVMNQLLHEPFVQLRQLANQPSPAYDQSLASLRQLFAF